MFTAGQLGADPATGKLVAGGLLPEIEQVRDLCAQRHGAGVGGRSGLEKARKESLSQAFTADLRVWCVGLIQRKSPFRKSVW